MQDAHWEAGELSEEAGVAEEVTRCSFCEAGLGDVHVLLVSHRGDFRIPDGFCSVDTWPSGPRRRPLALRPGGGGIRAETFAICENRGSKTP